MSGRGISMANLRAFESALDRASLDVQAGVMAAVVHETEPTACDAQVADIVGRMFTSGYAPHFILDEVLIAPVVSDAWRAAVSSYERQTGRSTSL